VDEKKGVTTIDVERYYHTTGVKVGGCCELRQKWYVANLSPRTYFAQGGDAYHRSKYIPKMMDMLCETLPLTMRRNRTNPTRIVVPEGYSVKFYDLTSFTSNLHVQRHFGQRLARFCKGYTVTVVDAVDGPIPLDLGDYILDYVDNQLIEPRYSLERVGGSRDLELVHSVAGFLGVYGNISMATYLHGAVMLQACHDHESANIAGDDGLIVREETDHTVELIATLGLISDEKCYDIEEKGCIHLKRPISLLGTHLIQGRLLAWPSLEHLFENRCDPRYPYIQSMSKVERQRVVANSITGFLQALTTYDLSKNYTKLISTYIKRMYARANLPREGNVPQCGNRQLGFVSAYAKRFIGLDPIVNTINRHYRGFAVLPRRGYEQVDLRVCEDPTFLSGSNALLNYLEILGYLEKKKQNVTVYGEIGLHILTKEYTDPDPSIYEYTIVRPLPPWAIQ